MISLRLSFQVRKAFARPCMRFFVGYPWTCTIAVVGEKSLRQPLSFRLSFNVKITVLLILGTDDSRPPRHGDAYSGWCWAGSRTQETFLDRNLPRRLAAFRVLDRVKDPSQAFAATVLLPSTPMSARSVLVARSSMSPSLSPGLFPFPILHPGIFFCKVRSWSFLVPRSCHGYRLLQNDKKRLCRKRASLGCKM